MIDLKEPNQSYFYGFMLTDGTLSQSSRNRGKLRLEISYKDRLILEEFKKIYPINSVISTRKRVTNFGYMESCTINFYDLNFRNELKTIGFPIGKKSNIADIPNCEFQEIDFIRGLIDGDGSVGFTNSNFPFISFTTQSENLKDYYLKFLERKLGYMKKINRNKRDNIYNIMVTRDEAVTIFKILYYDDCLCLERKNNKAISSWINPVIKKTQEQYEYEKEVILNNTVKESCKILGLCESSIYNKLSKIKSEKS